MHLAAKEIGFESTIENFLERRTEFIALNPAGNLPILVDSENQNVVVGSNVISEYIEEKYDEYDFLGININKRAEARRLQNWFEQKFYHEVTEYIVYQRYFNRYLDYQIKSPDTEILHVALRNLAVHLSYIEYLLENNKYLNGDQISIADFSAAAQLSILDYFGDINWHHHINVKEWYVLLKSHRFFNDILKDRITNIFPPPHYSQLDF
jgi:glutathione S-transferase